ncbi:hypothetical protein BC943DRAFT_364290 [Umbelopsis sp. AD052]|nr:hypothetical protein BC943DRAFT_364290 [Umbelopsis sp. AD052]
MLTITSIVLALCLIQYAQADDFVKVRPRSCYVNSPKEFLERYKKDHNALSCIAKTPRRDLSNELAYCECTYDGEGSITKILGFNAIVFGDFTTYGGEDILGRLAVQGNFNAPNYLVNANTIPVCYSKNIVPWGDLALAVGGNILSADTKVHGHWWAAGNGAAIELNEGCDSPAAVDIPFPFSDVLSDLLAMNERLATQTPDLFLSETGELTYNDNNSTNCYHVMTLAPCQRNPLNCLFLGQLSSPKAILFGIGNWNGPNKPYPSDGKVVNINVPVFNGDTFEIATDQPSEGANSCKLIWNFYPVDESGNYLSTGSFTIIRHTGSPFAGVVIAPLGNIIDGSSSVFEGAFIAKSYIWEQQNGVEIHDTPPCDYYHFCLPDVTTMASGINQESSSFTLSPAPPMTSTTTNQYSSDSSSMTSSTVTTTAPGINQESSSLTLSPAPLMTSITTNQYSSDSSSMTSSTVTTTAPGINQESNSFTLGPAPPMTSITNNQYSSDSSSMTSSTVTTTAPGINQESNSFTLSLAPLMASITNNQYSSDSSSMTSSTVTTTAPGINQESNSFTLSPVPSMTSILNNQYSSKSSIMTNSTTVPTTTTPGPESTSDATVHNTHIHHTYHHDHDHDHHWHDKDDDKDWHKKEDDEDWHKKDDEKDSHKKDDNEDWHKKDDNEDWHKKDNNEDWHKKDDNED